MVSTVATFGARHHDGHGIWYRYPREGGSRPYQGYQPPNTHLAKPEFLPQHFDRFEGARQEADLKEQENLEKCFSNDSETVGTAVSHEMASTAFNLFPGRNYQKVIVKLISLLPKMHIINIKPIK